MDYQTDRYDRAVQNTIEYVAYVCIQYGWISTHLHQHNWYSATACPHRTKTHCEDFKQKVDLKIAELQKGSPASNEAPADVAPAPKEEMVTISLHGYDRTVRARHIEGTVFVSVRELLEQMGYVVGWEDSKVTIQYRK